MTDSRYLKTTAVWDGASVYERVLKEVLDRLDGYSKPIRILVPAIGTGRVVKDLLERDGLPPITLHAVEPDQSKIEPDEEENKELKVHLAETGWAKRDGSGPDRYERDGSSIVIYNQHIETFLEENGRAESYDAIFCFLFFHYIPHCFISVLRELYSLLSNDGLFIVDEMQGADEKSEELLKCIDLHVDEFSSLSDYNPDCRSWKDFHLKRLYEEQAFWGSAVKATQPDIVLETLRPLFDPEKCTAVDSKPEKLTLTDKHLPWMWGHHRGMNDLSDRGEDNNLKDHFDSLAKDLSIRYKVHFFAGKRTELETSETWDIAKQKCRIKANDALDAILWSFKKGKDLEHSEIERLTHHVIPAVIMQLIASSGVFDYRHQVTSAFLATGSSPWAPQGMTLEGLHILNNPRGDQEQEQKQAKYWSINYHVYANILKRSLSASFIDRRLKFALGLKEDLDEDLLQNRGFETLPLPKADLGELDRVGELFPSTQILISLNLLSIDRSDPTVGVKLTNKDEEIVSTWERSLPNGIKGSDESDLSESIRDLSEKIKKVRDKRDFRREVSELLPVNLLAQKLGTVLFLPIPGYFEQDRESGQYSVRAIFGLGLTIRRVDEDTLSEVGDLMQVSESLIRRFHDKYLSLKWINDAREAARRSAITNIFARNFAHNIGSHVAINAGNKKIRARIKELYEGDIDLEAEHIRDWLDYMTERLNQYQVHRNEYLADFPNQSPVPMRLYRDLVLDFAENAILMDNLAKSERICFKRRGDGCVRNRLRIRTFIDGAEIQCSYPSAQDTEACGEDVVYPKAFPYVVLGKEHENGERDDVNEVFNNPDIGWVGSGSGESDVEVVVSNPHAFYSILENFIRNSAKHCEDKLREPENGWPDDLEVYVSAEENAESYCITLHDNVSVIGVEQALHFQKNAIEGSLLGDDMEPTRENSGIADMKVNAFLLSKPPEVLSDDTLTEEMDVVVCDRNCDEPSERDFKRLRGFKDDEDAGGDGRPLEELRADVGQEGYFGYQFRLPKPKKVCWVGPHEIDLKATPDKLGREGLAFHETVEAYFEASQGEQASLASYDFAVLREEKVRAWMEAGDDAQARLDQLLLALPCRALLVGGGEGDRPDALAEAVGQHRVVEVKDESVADGLLRRCWHAWLARWGVTDEKKAQAYLYAFEDTVGRWMGGEENPRKAFPDTFGPVDLTLVAKEEEDEKEKKKDDKNGDALLENDLPDEEGRLVIYERHGGFNKVFSPAKYREQVIPRLQTSDFTNAFDKNSTDFAQLNYPPKDTFQRELLTYRLVEAGLLRVLVIDERLVELSTDELQSLRYVFQTESVGVGGKTYGVPSWQEYFWYQASATNVFLVTDIVDENTGQAVSVGGEGLDGGFSLNLHEERASVNFQEGSENHDVGSAPFDVAILHRTLFIKMCNLIKRDEETEEAAAKRLIGKLRWLTPFVVIDSGGGEPHGIERSVPYRFISYSKLSTCFTSTGSKHVIAKSRLANHLLTLRRNAGIS